MTTEEKELLLKDLCARLPYGVKINFPSPSNEQDVVEKLRDVELRGEDILLSTTTWYNVKIDECEPYLRPLSSMTEKEKVELKSLTTQDLSEFAEHIRSGHGLAHDGLYMFDKLRQLDFCLSHHFDYRGLIEKGLALEAPEGMYNFKFKTTCNNCEDKNYCSQSEYVKNNCYKLK